MFIDGAEVAPLNAVPVSAASSTSRLGDDRPSLVSIDVDCTDAG